MVAHIVRPMMPPYAGNNASTPPLTRLYGCSDNTGRVANLKMGDSWLSGRVCFTSQHQERRSLRFC